MEPFYIKMIDPYYFSKGDTVTGNLGNKMLVLKVYKMTWWKQLINKTWFRRSWFIGIKVKGI
jgi:hypothetical protein